MTSNISLPPPLCATHGNVVSIAGSSPRPQFKRLLLRQAPKLCYCSKEEQHRAIRLCCHEEHYHSGAEGFSEDTPQLFSLLQANCHKTLGLGSSRWEDFNLRLPTSLVLLLLSVWPYSLPHLTAPPLVLFILILPDKKWKY